MRTVLVILNDREAYTTDTYLPNSLVKAYAKMGVVAYVLPEFLTPQAM
jgi:hypothetical protein